jgi:hypothetical protein
VLRAWGLPDTLHSPHAIAMLSAGEGTSPLELQFYSSEAEPSLRPTLRISYVPFPPPRSP